MENKVYVLIKEIVKNNNFDSKLSKIHTFLKFNDASYEMGKQYYGTCDEVMISRKEFVEKSKLDEAEAKIITSTLDEDEYTITWTISEGLI